jgi:hypothetical protein
VVKRGKANSQIGKVRSAVRGDDALEHHAGTLDEIELTEVLARMLKVRHALTPKRPTPPISPGRRPVAPRG